MLLDFLALRLLFVQLGLQFRGHLVVTVLCFLQVKAHLVNVCKGVQVLVLVQHFLSVLLILVAVSAIQNEDALLQILIGALELLVFLALVLYCENELLLHLCWRGKVAHTFVNLLIIVILEIIIFVVQI